MADVEYLSLADSSEDIRSAAIDLPGGRTTNWPASTRVGNIEDPRIFGAVFADFPLVHPQLRDACLAQASQQPTGILGFGGKKVREQVVWDLPSAKLLTRRALLLYCQTQKVTSAHTTDFWANVMESGDYSYPHCHYDSVASLVYYLDLGDEDPREKMAGKFHLSDPRIPYCCTTDPNRPTRGLLPNLREGLFLLFPSEFVHFVHPHRGTRPRITLAWNIATGPPPVSDGPKTSDVPRGMFGGQGG
jgi:hypothetical protein